MQSAYRGKFPLAPLPRDGFIAAVRSAVSLMVVCLWEHQSESKCRAAREEHVERSRSQLARLPGFRELPLPPAIGGGIHPGHP